MGVYNEFYVFDNKSVIPETECCIHNRAVGIFFREHIRGYMDDREFYITKEQIEKLLFEYSNGTLKRSPLSNPRDPVLFPDEVSQLCEIKRYLDAGFKVVYRQIS